MRGGAILLNAAAFGAGAGAWALAPHMRPAATVALASTSASGGRLYLTKAQLDQAIASGTLDRPVKSLLAVKAPLHFGDYTWDDRGIPPGPVWVRVDLHSQL